MEVSRLEDVVLSYRQTKLQPKGLRNISALLLLGVLPGEQNYAVMLVISHKLTSL